MVVWHLKHLVQDSWCPSKQSPNLVYPLSEIDSSDYTLNGCPSNTAKISKQFSFLFVVGLGGEISKSMISLSTIG